MIIEDALLITSFLHNSVHSVKLSSLVEKMFLRYFIDNSRTHAQHGLFRIKKTPSEDQRSLCTSNCLSKVPHMFYKKLHMGSMKTNY